MRYWHGEDRDVLIINAAKIECAHRRESELLSNYNQIMLTFFTKFMITLHLLVFQQIPLIFIIISKTNYLLINHLICTPDKE